MRNATNLADSKLSQKYQTVIPQPIREALGVKKGDELIWVIKVVGQKPIAQVYPKPKSWTEYMRGLGKEVWRKVNVESYIKELRNEWDKKY